MYSSNKQYSQKLNFAMKALTKTIVSNWQKNPIATLLAVSIEMQIKTVINSMHALLPVGYLALLE